MPKQLPRLDRSAQLQLERVLIDSLWLNDGDRQGAIAFFEDGLRAAPVHPTDAIVALIEQQAGATPQRPPTTKALLDSRELPPYEDVAQYTPGLAAFIAVEALTACKGAGNSGSALDRCLERSTDARLFINGAPR
jgi:hypothetical protein